MATIDLSRVSPTNPSVVNGLRKAVAQSYSLLALSHNAHVNLVGPDFFQLHAVLGDIYEGALGDADLYAERIRSLDAFCHICLTEMDSASGLPCLPTPFAAREGIAAVLSAFDIIIKDLTSLMNTADATGDKVTANMIQDKVAAAQKQTWMLKSYLR